MKETNKAFKLLMVTLFVLFLTIISLLPTESELFVGLVGSLSVPFVCAFICFNFYHDNAPPTPGVLIACFILNVSVKINARRKAKSPQSMTNPEKQNTRLRHLSHNFHQHKHN